MSDTKSVINAWSGWVPVAMSAAAVSLLVFALQTGWGKGLHGDEGAAAHLWQLLIGLQVPLILVFLATAKWRSPMGVLGLLGLQVLGLILAMAPVAILRL